MELHRLVGKICQSFSLSNLKFHSFLGCTGDFYFCAPSIIEFPFMLFKHYSIRPINVQVLGLCLFCEPKTFFVPNHGIRCRMLSNHLNLNDITTEFLQTLSPHQLRKVWTPNNRPWMLRDPCSTSFGRGTFVILAPPCLWNDLPYTSWHLPHLLLSRNCSKLNCIDSNSMFRLTSALISAPRICAL